MSFPGQRATEFEPSKYDLRITENRDKRGYSQYTKEQPRFGDKCTRELINYRFPLDLEAGMIEKLDGDPVEGGE